MKQKDIIVILVVVFLAGSLSLLVSKKLFDKPQNSNVSVKVVDPISTEFVKPDKKYFNENSLNPTQTIRIGSDQTQIKTKQ